MSPVLWVLWVIGGVPVNQDSAIGRLRGNDRPTRLGLHRLLLLSIRVLLLDLCLSVDFGHVGSSGDSAQVLVQGTPRALRL